MSGSRLRLILALVLSPVIGFAVATLLYGGILAYLHPLEDFDFFSAAIMSPLYGVMFALSRGIPAMIVFGLPVHILLCRLRQAHVWGYAFSGVVVATIVPYVATIATPMPPGSSYTIDDALGDLLGTLPLAALIGLFTAIVAWLIRRPDRDSPNPATPAP
jgi:hypothetical protein